MANKPVQKISNGAVSASVWANRRTVNDVDVDIYSVTLAKNYKDKAGEWRSTNSLNVADIPKAISVLQRAYEALVVTIE